MVYSTLFFLTLTFSVTAEECQQPVGSGVLDIQQVTTIQYCFIDNCTIMRIDTGEELDIVYTTQSFLVTTPTGNQTSMVIAKKGKPLSCLIVTDNRHHHTAELVVANTVEILTILVSGSIFVMHLLFKQLHNLFGMLLMLYSIVMVLNGFVTLALVWSHVRLATHSQITCSILLYLEMEVTTISEALATCILVHLAYIMYRSCKVRPAIPTTVSKALLKYYTAYVASTTVLFTILITGFDFGTKNGKYSLIPGGYCIFMENGKYNTINFMYAFVYLNKLLQILAFSIYLYSFYKLHVYIRDAQVNLNHRPYRITMAMGATIGITQFICLILDAVGLGLTGGLIGDAFMLAQQCIIMASFMCTAKMKRLCKQHFCH